MRTRIGGGIAALTLGLCSGTFAAPPPASVHLSGEYVEARTCNVYTGACHAMSEATTTGREALMAWDIEQGTVDGVKVNGVKVVAAVTADANLAHDPANVRSVLYVDSRATAAQKDAIVRTLESRYAKELGTVVAVKSAPVTFAKDGLEYTVRVPNAAFVKTTRYAGDCCIMPHEVWYQPLVSLKSSMVALASSNEFKGAPELDTRWSRPGENSSFVGNFAF